MSEGTENLIRIVNELQDKLHPLGVTNLGLDLPQIAVIGGQSAGKSSVLESFVGRDFLPRGNNIVTRRPLVLQLIHNKEPKSFGEFLHIRGKRFYDFTHIRDEITNETDREVKDNYGISPKPINLKIFSPDVLDLTLVDLPGMTRIPVGNQPKDIEQRIENMILEYIERDNCLILAVTAANQDLATSDALKLAEKVDPNGERTIGVLTKLDLMDKGTDARAILLNKHLPLKMGYIGIVNRSQKDIDTKKNMKDAFADEQDYFKTHPSYKDIANRLGVGYLQTYLNKELTKHILKILPPLQHKFQAELDELSEELERIQHPINDSDNEKILSEANEQFRKNYESSVGGKGVKLDITKLSGGAKINLIMNNTFAKDINQMIYDEHRMRREIATAIQNFYGIYLGIFTPDAAFKAVVEHQIEQFRKPSLVCVEWVSQELENIIKDSVQKIKRFSHLKQLYAKITLEYVRECKKRCKVKVERFVETEKTYLNTIHDDFIGVTSTGVENLKPISDSQLLVSEQVVDESASKLVNGNNKPKADWISYKKNDYWFVLTGQTLSWYKNEKLKDKKNSVSLKGAKLEQDDSSLSDCILVLIINKKGIELTFDSSERANKWREWLMEAGVECSGSGLSFNKDSDSYSVSNMSITDNSFAQQNGTAEEEMAFADHMRGPVDQVKRLVDSYIVIMKKKFKDYIPKMCTIEMIDSTLEFIAVDLRLRVREEISSIDDIVKGDPEEELRRDLTKKSAYYSEAIDIIDKITKYESV